MRTVTLRTMLGRDLRKRYLGRGGLGLNGLPSLVMCIAIACLNIFPFFFCALGRRGERVGVGGSGG